MLIYNKYRAFVSKASLLGTTDLTDFNSFNTVPIQRLQSTDLINFSSHVIHGVVLNLKARHWSGTKSEVRPSGLFEKAHQDIQDGASNVNICLSVFLVFGNS